MRRSLAKRGLDANDQSTLAALLDIPTDPGSWKVKTRRPVQFVTTPRSQLAEMELDELLTLEQEIKRKIDTVSGTIHSLDVDPHILKRAYLQHLARLRKTGPGGADGGGLDGTATAAATAAAFPHLRLQMPAAPDDGADGTQPRYRALRRRKGELVRDARRYTPEGLLRMRELFQSYCTPGYDALGFVEVRELFVRAGVLPPALEPTALPAGAPRALELGPRSFALADAFFDQTCFEQFVVQVLDDRATALAEERAAARGAAPGETLNERMQLIGKAPGLAIGLRFEGFAEFMRVLERTGHASLFDMLQRLGLPLSASADRWRRRVEQALAFVVRVAVEERGPTQEEIEMAEAQRELIRAQSMRGRPKAKKRKRRKPHGARGARGAGGRVPGSPGEGEDEDGVGPDGLTKEQRRAEYMKRRLELEKQRRADQRLQWKRRYHYDIDELVDPWNFSLLIHELTGVALTLEDAGALLTPLLESEREDDAVTFARVVAQQRTKRLRVIVEKQGMPPRVWPMRHTVATHLIAHREYWTREVQDSTVFHPPGEDPASSRPGSSRPGSRASSRSGSRHSRPGSRAGRGASGGSRPSSRGTAAGPGSRPGSRGGAGASSGRMVGAWGAKSFLPPPPSPQLWAHRCKLFTAHAFRRLRQVGRRVRAAMYDRTSKMPPSASGEAVAEKKTINLGKSKADKAERKRLKQEALERMRAAAKANDGLARAAVSVGALDRAHISTQDKEDVVTWEAEWKREKGMDLGDVLDKVDAPEECAHFISVGITVGPGWEDDDDEVDRSVVVVRRIVKLFLEEQLFKQLPLYHSYSVLYDPDVSPRVVRCSVYFTGTDKEMRTACGIPMPLTSVLERFESKGMFSPAATTLFNRHRMEDIVLDKEFKLRANATIKYKRGVAARLLGHLGAALRDFFPFAKADHGTPAAASTAVRAKTAAAEAAEAEVQAGEMARRKPPEEVAVGANTERKEETEKREEAEGKYGEEGGGGAEGAEDHATLRRSPLPSEVNEKEGGPGILPRLRRAISRLCEWLPHTEKTDIEFAVPALSVLLAPETPDVLRASLDPATLAALKHLCTGAGGMMDTVKVLWNAVVGEEFAWHHMERRLRAILELMEHGESTKEEELIQRAHVVCREILIGVTDARVQCGERGLICSFGNLRWDGLVPYCNNLGSLLKVKRAEAAKLAAKKKAEAAKKRAAEARKKAKQAEAEQKQAQEEAAAKKFLAKR